VFSSHKELLKSIDSNKLVGLVPTMGSLHKGHLSLVERALSENEQVIVTIYVNPTQFNDINDLKQYPRNLESDIDKLRDYKNIFIYSPRDKDLYQEVVSKNYDLDNLDKILEGKYRPGHFNGVATIVEKLFTIFNPNNSYFGEKDFQQLSIIKTMVKKLSISVNIISCETIREADGLAMSSRNKNMTTEERLIAGEINKFMIKVKEIYNNKKIDKVPISIIDELNSLKNCKLEYFEIDNLSKHSSSLTDEGDRIFIACWVGKTRIIDNLALKKFEKKT
jgi:pantoate--beta-alanine ligase